MKGATRCWQSATIVCLVVASLSWAKALSHAPMRIDGSDSSPSRMWKRLNVENYNTRPIYEVEVLRDPKAVVYAPQGFESVGALNDAERRLVRHYVPEIVHNLFETWTDDSVTSQVRLVPPSQESSACSPSAATASPVPDNQYEGVRDNLVLYADLRPADYRCLRDSYGYRPGEEYQDTLTTLIRRQVEATDRYGLYHVRRFNGPVNDGPGTFRLIWYLGGLNPCDPPPAQPPPDSEPTSTISVQPVPASTQVPSGSNRLETIEDVWCRESQGWIMNWFSSASG